MLQTINRKELNDMEQKDLTVEELLELFEQLTPEQQAQIIDLMQSLSSD